MSENPAKASEFGITSAGGIPQSPEYAKAQRELTPSKELLKFYPPGYDPTPPPQLVDADAKYLERIKPFLGTAGAVFDLMGGIQVYELADGDMSVRSQPSIYSLRLPKDCEPRDKYDALERAKEGMTSAIMKIVADLKEEGVDGALPPGSDAETALLTLATLQYQRQEFADLLKGMSWKERTALEADMKVLPGLMRRLHMDYGHACNAMPWLRNGKEEAVLKRYFEGKGSAVCKRIAIIQQLEAKRNEAGMPQIQDTDVDQKVDPWLGVQLYVPSRADEAERDRMRREYQSKPVWAVTTSERMRRDLAEKRRGFQARRKVAAAAA
jgi:hypothetical protein